MVRIFLFLFIILSTKVYANDITLMWDDNSNNEDGFKIESSAIGGTFIVIDTVGPNIIEYTATDITQDTIFRVKAFNTIADSSPSNEVLYQYVSNNEIVLEILMQMLNTLDIDLTLKDRILRDDWEAIRKTLYDLEQTELNVKFKRELSKLRYLAAGIKNSFANQVSFRNTFRKLLVDTKTIYESN